MCHYSLLVETRVVSCVFVSSLNFLETLKALKKTTFLDQLKSIWVKVYSKGYFTS